MMVRAENAFPTLFLLLCIVSTTLFPGIASAGNEHTVAFVVKSLSNPFFSEMVDGARKFAHDNEVVLEVFGVDRETDVEHQISIVENLISRGYRAIILAPTDSKRLVPVCIKAVNNNIVVINVETPLHQPTLEKFGLSIPFVGSDGFNGGKKLGAYIKSKLRDQGRVLVIEGVRGAQSSELRKAGFIDAVTENSSIEVVSSQSANWHSDEALSITIKFLTEHPSIDAIFCANDVMLLGVLQALDLVEISRPILLAGYDNIEPVRVEMRGGRIHATVEQHPEVIGELGVQTALNKMHGIAVPLSQSTPLDLITYEHFGKKIVFSVSSLENAFFSIMEQRAKETADLFGMQLTVLDAENQDTRQLADIAKVITQQTDLLIVNPTNSDSVYPGIELANSSGTPVITVDRKSSAGKVLCHIESDNREGGRMAARFLAKSLGESGSVLELEGIPGTSAAHERGEGFNAELKKYDKIKIAYREVANFDRQEARVVTLQLLEQKVSLDGVFAHNDNMILGFIDAYESAKKTLPKVMVGFDAIPEAEESIRNGRLTATIAQQPEALGQLAVTAAAQYFRGDKVPTQIFTELSLVTQ